MHFILKFKKSAVLKSFNLRHLWCRFSYLKDKIILLGYLFARKLKTVLCGYRISDVTVAKKPLGIWYKFPIRFRSVRIPSVSRQCPVHAPSTYLTIPVHAIRDPFLIFLSVQTISGSHPRKTISSLAQSAVHAPSTNLTIIIQSVHRSFPYISPARSHPRISPKTENEEERR